ncbi:MAG TPA: cupin domain-containing protein [Burkholderiales bacterium]|nr:cupin domain-containing protein [Burkholderiales bacterium]
MNRKQVRGTAAFVEQMARVAWREFPGHFGGALSKMLVGPEKGGSARVDFRISRYAPNAYVEEHSHRVQEQIYYVIEGEGVLTVDGEEHLMRPHDYVYLPPGVRHAITNTGTGGLVFFVVTTPASDEAAV